MDLWSYDQQLERHCADHGYVCRGGQVQWHLPLGYFPPDTKCLPIKWQRSWDISAIALLLNTREPQRLTGWDNIAQIQQRSTLSRGQFSVLTATVPSSPFTSRLSLRCRVTPTSMGTEVLGDSTLKLSAKDPYYSRVVVLACHPGPWEGEAEPLSAAQAT